LQSHAGAIEEHAAGCAHLRLLPGKAVDDAAGVRDLGGAEAKRVAHAGRTLGRRRLIIGEGARHGTDEARYSDGDNEAAANRGHGSLLWFSAAIRSRCSRCRSTLPSNGRPYRDGRHMTDSRPKISDLASVKWPKLGAAAGRIGCPRLT